MRKLPMLILAFLLPAFGATRANADGPFVFPGGRPARPALLAVPDLVGRAYGEAQALLAASGLQGLLSGLEANLVNLEAVRGLRVAAQSPLAGTLLPAGSQVSLTLAAGARPGHDRDGGARGPGGREHGWGYGRLRRMPDLSGLPIPEARALLEQQGLAVTVEERVAPQAALGVVLLQQPEAGQWLPRGGVAVLSIARATRVPQLVGLSLAEARHQARQAGLLLEGEERLGRRGFADDPRLGGSGALGGYQARRLMETLLRVSSQGRLAGSPIAEGSTLRIEARLQPVALPGGPGHGRPDGWTQPFPHGTPGTQAPFAPPVNQMVVVPGVTGRPLSEALALLEAQGLVADVAGLRDGTPGGTRPGYDPIVATQDLSVGTGVTRGTTVHLGLAPRRR